MQPKFGGGVCGCGVGVCGCGVWGVGVGVGVKWLFPGKCAYVFKLTSKIDIFISYIIDLKGMPQDLIVDKSI